MPSVVWQQYRSLQLLPKRWINARLADSSSPGHGTRGVTLWVSLCATTTQCPPPPPPSPPAAKIYKREFVIRLTLCIRPNPKILPFQANMIQNWQPSNYTDLASVPHFEHSRKSRSRGPGIRDRHSYWLALQSFRPSLYSFTWSSGLLNKSLRMPGVDLIFSASYESN